MSLIYVLEDDSNIREIEEYALNASSYEVKGFETAAAFREGLRQQMPEVFFRRGRAYVAQTGWIDYNI